MARSEKRIAAEILASKRDYWERLRRNDGYKADFERFVEIYKGRDKGLWQDVGVVDELTRRLASHYRLLYPLDPKITYSDKIISKVVLSGECWIEDAQVDWDGKRILHPIEKESFYRIKSLNDKHKPIYEPRKRTDFLIEGKYLRFLVDIDTSKEQAQSSLKRAIDFAKANLKDNCHRKVKLQIREKHENNSNAFKIWDLRRKGLTLEEAWQIIEPNTSTESAKSKAHQHFKKAQKLISALGTRPIFKSILSSLKTEQPHLFRKSKA